MKIISNVACKRQAAFQTFVGIGFSLALSAVLAILAKTRSPRVSMRSISAADAKNGFGQLIDLARREPIKIEKHGRAVVVVLSIEEYERLERQATIKQTDTQKQGT